MPHGELNRAGFKAACCILPCSFACRSTHPSDHICVMPHCTPCWHRQEGQIHQCQQRQAQPAEAPGSLCFWLKPELTANACNPPQVWYKHDLRVDDHPGLVQAAADGGGMVAAVVLDPAMYTHLLATPCGVEGEALLSPPTPRTRTRRFAEEQPWLGSSAYLPYVLCCNDVASFHA